MDKRPAARASATPAHHVRPVQMVYLANFVRVLFSVLTLAIFARVLISWFPVRPDNPIVQILNEVTDPILRPLRRIVPPLGMLDLTPIVALILIQIVGRLLEDALR